MCRDSETNNSRKEHISLYFQRHTKKSQLFHMKPQKGVLRESAVDCENNVFSKHVPVEKCKKVEKKKTKASRF